jgi:hypothetical protein
MRKTLILLALCLSPISACVPAPLITQSPSPPSAGTIKIGTETLLDITATPVSSPTGELLSGIDVALDCAGVETIDPVSAEAQAALSTLLAYHQEANGGQLQPDTPFEFAEVRTVVRQADWILVQASFSHYLEPGIFLLKRIPQGFEYDRTLWGGQAENATELRRQMVQNNLDVPPELLACFQIAEWFVPAETPQLTSTSLAGLLIESYPLRSLDADIRAFTPVQGTMKEVLSKRATERGKVNDPFDPHDPLEISAVLNGEPLTARVLFPAAEETNQTGVDRVEVTKSNQLIYSLPLGHAGPIQILQGFWTSNDHWYLEAAQYVPESDYPDAIGRIVRDGELLSELYGYDGTFSFQLLNGQPFFFFEKDEQFGFNYDGQESLLPFDSIAHYGCCSGARLNPIKAENMVSFYATREGQWYYVEIGKYD